MIVNGFDTSSTQSLPTLFKMWVIQSLKLSRWTGLPLGQPDSLKNLKETIGYLNHHCAEAHPLLTRL